MTGLWCGVEAGDGTELHMFPVEEGPSACRRRMRGRDHIRFVMKGSPSAPGGCVCMRCWEIWAEAVLR